MKVNIEEQIANTKDQTDLRNLTLRDLIRRYDYEPMYRLYEKIYQSLPSYKNVTENYNFLMREKHLKVYYTVKNIMEKEE